MMNTIKTPISYYGGKKQMLKYILPLIPDHKVYSEPFFGGGAVFFAKKEAKCEMINDINHNVINFYRVYQTRPAELNERVKVSLFARHYHNQAREIYRNPDLHSDIDRAWAFWFLANACFNGDLYGNMKFSRADDRSYKFIQSAKENLINPLTIKRIEKAQIDCRDALLVLEAMDQPKTFHYVDPPYMNADQGHYTGYTLSDYQNLLTKLSTLKGRFLLSCYPDELVEIYAKEYKWQVHGIQMRASASAIHGKRVMKTELLVSNYHFRQGKLF
jgi:DNA adenine methylase